MIDRSGYGPVRGRLTISGFRRPEPLKAFGRVTMMSALFEHTHLHDVCEQLDVQFKPSSLVRVSEKTTPLGSRRLKIYWLTDQGWSKRTRDRSGGIGPIFDLIVRSGVLDPAETTCLITNLDDASEADPHMVFEHFGKNAVIMPHNCRG